MYFCSPMVTRDETCDEPFDVITTLESILSSSAEISKELGKLQLLLSRTEVTTISNWYLEELYLLSQTSTLDDYYNRFQAVKDTVAFGEPGFSEESYTLLFVNGLQTNIRQYVQRLNPTTVIDAYDTACIFEYSCQSQKSVTLDSSVNLIDDNANIMLTESDKLQHHSSDRESNSDINLDNCVDAEYVLIAAGLKTEEIIGDVSIDDCVDELISAAALNVSSVYNGRPMLLSALPTIGTPKLAEDKGGTAFHITSLLDNRAVLPNSTLQSYFLSSNVVSFPMIYIVAAHTATLVSEESDELPEESFVPNASKDDPVSVIDNIALVVAYILRGDVAEGLFIDYLQFTHFVSRTYAKDETTFTDSIQNCMSIFVPSFVNSSISLRTLIPLKVQNNFCYDPGIVFSESLQEKGTCPDIIQLEPVIFFSGHTKTVYLLHMLSSVAYLGGCFFAVFLLFDDIVAILRTYYDIGFVCWQPEEHPSGIAFLLLVNYKEPLTLWIVESEPGLAPPMVSSAARYKCFASGLYFSCYELHHQGLKQQIQRVAAAFQHFFINSSKASATMMISKFNTILSFGCSDCSAVQFGLLEFNSKLAHLIAELNAIQMSDSAHFSASGAFFCFLCVYCEVVVGKYSPLTNCVYKMKGSRQCTHSRQEDLRVFSRQFLVLVSTLYSTSFQLSATSSFELQCFSCHYLHYEESEYVFDSGITLLVTQQRASFSSANWWYKIYSCDLVSLIQIICSNYLIVVIMCLDPGIQSRLIAQQFIIPYAVFSEKVRAIHSVLILEWLMLGWPSTVGCQWHTFIGVIVRARVLWIIAWILQVKVSHYSLCTPNQQSLLYFMPSLLNGTYLWILCDCIWITIASIVILYMGSISRKWMHQSGVGTLLNHFLWHIAWEVLAAAVLKMNFGPSSMLIFASVYPTQFQSLSSWLVGFLWHIAWWFQHMKTQKEARLYSTIHATWSSCDGLLGYRS